MNLQLPHTIDLWSHDLLIVTRYIHLIRLKLDTVLLQVERSKGMP